MGSERKRVRENERALLGDREDGDFTRGRCTLPATVDVVVSAAPAVAITVAPESPMAGVPAAITVTATSGTTANPRQVQTLELDFGDGLRETRTNVTGTLAPFLRF